MNILFTLLFTLFLSTQALAECGIASTYGHGRLTANGEHYNPHGISAAHKHLPFGSVVRVRNTRTGRTISVRINDRGPFVGGRIIDLSSGAMAAIGGNGLIPVCIEVVSQSKYYGHNKGGHTHVRSSRKRRRHRQNSHRH